MNKVVLALLSIFSLYCFDCRSGIFVFEDKPSSENMIFEYKNDTLIQRVEAYKISNDSLNLTIESINLKSKKSCSMKGIAVRDTVGDFLQEEETEQDKNGLVFSVVNYLFYYEGSVMLLNIAIERLDQNKLLYRQINSTRVTQDPFCLLYSVGTLIRK